MQSFLFEWKKMMYYQKGILILLLCLLCRILVLLVMDVPYDDKLEQNRESYQFYLEQIDGKLDEEKAVFLEEEAEKIAKATSDFQTQYDDINSMTQEEWTKRAESIAKTLENESGFDVIYEQYLYVKEEPEQRYFLYTNGWNSLLANDSLDWFTVILILALTVPVFCQEDESKMDMLLISSYRGSKYNTQKKILVVSLTAMAISIFNSITSYLFYHIKYGLPHGSYPIQSLDFFSTSEKSLTLAEAFLFVSALRVLGCLLFGICIQLLASVLKKYIVTAFSGLVLIIVPYGAGQMNSIMYHLPGPLGLMLATGYLRGTVYDRKDSSQITFQGVENIEFAILLVISGTIGIFSYYVVKKSHTNRWSFKKKIKLSKYGKAVRLLLLWSVLLFTLNSCGKQNITDDIDYNSLDTGIWNTEQYLVYTRYTDGKTQIMCEDKDTGNVFDAIRDPLTSNVEISDLIYCTGSYIYYMKYICNNIGFFGSYQDKVMLMKIDTKDFTEEVVYEENLKSNNDSWIKLESGETDALSFFQSLSKFFVIDNTLYGMEEKSIVSLNLLTGKKMKVIQSPNLKSMAAKNECIFYLNEYSNVVCYQLDSGKESVFDEIAAKSFKLYEGEIYFINLKDFKKLYVYDMDTGKSKKVINEEILFFDFDKKYIFYQSGLDTFEYRIGLDGTDKRLVTDELACTVCDIPEYEYIIYYNYSNEIPVLSKYNRDTLEKLE